jgi:3-oxoacyl-[acyl-carrier protein] reductase
LRHDLSGRVALVTGASRGLGAAIAVKLGNSGARVAVNYHSQQGAAEKVCDQIREWGVDAAPFQADVTDEEAVKRLVTEVREQLGVIDVVVLNATGPQPFLTIEQQTWEAYLEQLIFFVKSPLLVVKEVLPEMKRRKHGRIINIGSEAVEVGTAEFANYVAAKAAQLGLTRSWARELGPYGITVNLVAPGWIPTERHASTDRKELARYVAKVPLHRQGAPVDVAEAVAFLASDAACFITGQKLSVNGGHTLE